MVDAWSQRAEHYASSSLFQAGPELGRLLALARPTWSDSCLDIGTGTGHVAALLAKHAGNVIGLDPSEAMLRSAMADYGHVNNLDFVFGYAHDTGQLAASYDIVTVRHAAHHFASIQGFLAESYRVLKPGGRLVIVDEVTADTEIDDWFHALETLRDDSHHRAYLMREWHSFIDSSGLQWVVGDQYTRLPIEVSSWLARSNLDHEGRADVYEHFMLASPKERSLLNIRYENRMAVSFDLPLAMILAIKPLEESA